jgi:hypothetical protein
MNEIFRYGLDHLTVPIALKLVNGELEGVLTEEVKLESALTMIKPCFKVKN